MQPTSGQDEGRGGGSRVDRPEERERVAGNVAAQLRQRGADVRGDESDAELADLLTAVQRFERARAERGGDSFVNTPESTQPDDDALVVPQREERESAADYVRRVARAAERLGGGGK